MTTSTDHLARLAAVIESRRGGDPDKSYVARLFAKGTDSILKKIGEEATDVYKRQRITTAALAERLEVSEAALYRHFASKAQMFEGLIEFIETTVFTLINQVVERETQPSLQAQKVCVLLLQFGEKNPGMTRVMVGDALVFEHERLIARMNQFFDRVESQLRQSLRAAAEAAGSPTPTVDAQALASATTALLVGRLQRYARSGFKRLPTEHLEPALQRLTS